MPFCSHCGNEISAQAVACPRCGHPGPGRATTVDLTALGGPVADVARADYGQRAGAYLIDLAIVMGVMLVLFIAAFAGALEAFLGVTVLGGIAASLYKPLLEGSRGQTLGKMALGIKVVRAADASPIGYGEAFIRWAIMLVAGAVPFGLLIDLLWPLWDRYDQTLHDKVAKTIVVRA